MSGVHQLVVSATPGDAIYDYAALIRETLRGWGYRSELYAANVAPALEGEARYFTRYRPRPDDVVLFHYSIGSELSSFVQELPCSTVLIYHNVTPPEYVEQFSGEMTRQVRVGREELPAFKESVRLALGVSEYNRRELVTLGFPRTGILPLVLNEGAYELAPNEALLNAYDDGSVNLLFVGRVSANKRHDDVLKIFHYYRQIRPESRLFFVGKPWDPAARYENWLRGIVDYLGMGEAVVFTGHVPFRDMVTYYRLADVFVCMSEHEGFGKPLIESMYFDLPVVAYAAAGVPGTLADAGVLVHRKEYPLIAEMIELLVTDGELRETILEGQRRRLQDFRQKTMVALLREHLAPLLGGVSVL